MIWGMMRCKKQIPFSIKRKLLLCAQKYPPKGLKGSEFPPKKQSMDLM